MQIKLWGGLIAEVNLPLLLLTVFLLGLLPMLLYHHTVRWRLRQRLATAQGTVETLRTPAYLPPAPVLRPDPEPTPPVILTAVPPGGA